jgi:hypothetical protein
MKNRATLAFVSALVTSALVWAISPWLTGQREPWDAEFPYYLLALLVAGVIAGGLAPKPLWAHYLGAFIGQLGYELIFLKIGPLFVLGAVFLLGYCLVFLAAAAIAGYLRLRFMRRRFPD